MCPVLVLNPNLILKGNFRNFKLNFKLVGQFPIRDCCDWSVNFCISPPLLLNMLAFIVIFEVFDMAVYVTLLPSTGLACSCEHFQFIYLFCVRARARVWTERFFENRSVKLLLKITHIHVDGSLLARL